jgi:hypothetical protein
MFNWYIFLNQEKLGNPVPRLFVGRPVVVDGADGAAPLDGHEGDGPDLAQSGNRSKPAEGQTPWSRINEIVSVHIF